MTNLFAYRTVFIFLFTLSWLFPQMSYSVEPIMPRADLQQAQSWGNRQPTFSELDKNGDNLISREEAKQWDSLNKNFASVDQDQNSKIDQSEFSDFETKKIKESIKDFIKN